MLTLFASELCKHSVQALCAGLLCGTLFRHSNKPGLGCLVVHLINTHVCLVLLHVDKVWPEEGPALPQEAPLCNMDRCAC